jgi:hypothetical protein
VEFEETFPDEPETQPQPPVPAAPPRLTVVRAEPETSPTPVPSSSTDVSEAMYQEQLDRRLREAEELVTRTIEKMRLEEERRLVEWVRERREQEERRLASWAEERRSAMERSLEQRASTEDGLARRIEDLLTEWQARFEQRLEQRRIDDDRVAERRRLSDEERLAAWRGELEQALSERFTEKRPGERAPLPDRNGELRVSLRDAIATSASARDVGRILRDVLSEIARTAAFAVAVHHPDRDDVAYRYRVAADDELGALLRRDTLDDGPDGAAAHMDGWVRTHRTVRLGDHNATVHTAQLAIRGFDTTIGVVTLQTETNAIPDALLARIGELVALAAPRLGDLRARGSFRGA